MVRATPSAVFDNRFAKLHPFGAPHCMLTMRDYQYKNGFGMEIKVNSLWSLLAMLLQQSGVMCQ
jgi:hypothetical protein